MLRSAVCACLTLLIASLAPARAEVQLKRKFTPNTKSNVKVHVNMNQVLTINGQQVPTEVETTMTNEIAVGEKADGTVPVKVQMESVHADISTPMGNFSYDSANPGAADGNNPIAEIYKAMTGTALTYQVDDAGKALFVEGVQEFLDSASEQAAQMLKHSVSQETLLKEFNQVTNRLPNEPVNEGDTWRRIEDVDIGAGQTMTFGIEYQYAGTVKKNGKTYDRITSKADSVTYAQADDAPTPAKVTASSLKVDDWMGELLYDREGGHINNSTSKARITGKLTLAIGGQQLDANLDLKIAVDSEEIK